MTDTATQPQRIEDQHDVDTSADQGGSPSEDLQAVGADDNADDSQDTRTLQNGNREAELEAQLLDMHKTIVELDDRIRSDPELTRRVYGGEQGEPEKGYDWNGITETLEEHFEPDAAAALKRTLVPVFDHIGSLEAQLKEVTGRTQALGRSVGGAEFRGALSREGVDRKAQESAAWGKHLRRMRSSKGFQSLEAKSPRAAADYAASKWHAGRARALSNQDDHARLSSAKNGRGAKGSQSSSALAEKVIEVVRSGNFIARADDIRQKATAAQEPMPRIKYVNPQ